MGKIHLSATALLIGTLASPSIGAIHTFRFIMNGAQEVPPVVTTATGFCTVTLNDSTNQVTVACTYSGLTSNANNAHIHAGAPGVSGGPIVNLTFTAATSGTAQVTNAAMSPANVAAMIAGNTYVNIHSVNNGNGEIRGQIAGNIPAVSTWGVVATTILLVIAATVVLYRKKHALSRLDLT